MLRKIKRDTGRVVGRQGQRGASVYNRFRGQGSLPSSQASPKSFIITETSEQTKSVRTLHMCVCCVEPQVVLYSSSCNPPRPHRQRLPQRDMDHLEDQSLHLPLPLPVPPPPLLLPHQNRMRNHPLPHQKTSPISLHTKSHLLLPPLLPPLLRSCLHLKNQKRRKRRRRR